MCTVVLQFAYTATCAPSWTDCLHRWNSSWEFTWSCRSHHNLYSYHLGNFLPFNTCRPNTENNSGWIFLVAIMVNAEVSDYLKTGGINVFWSLAVALSARESSSQKSISTMKFSYCSLPIAFNTLKCYRKLTLVPQETNILITKADSNAPALASFQWQIPTHAGNKEITVANTRCPNTKHKM